MINEDDLKIGEPIYKDWKFYTKEIYNTVFEVTLVNETGNQVAYTGPLMEAVHKCIEYAKELDQDKEQD